MVLCCIHELCRTAAKAAMKLVCTSSLRDVIHVKLEPRRSPLFILQAIKAGDKAGDEASTISLAPFPGFPSILTFRYWKSGSLGTWTQFIFTMLLVSFSLAPSLIPIKAVNDSMRLKLILVKLLDSVVTINLDCSCIAVPSYPGVSGGRERLVYTGRACA